MKNVTYFLTDLSRYKISKPPYSVNSLLSSPQNFSWSSYWCGWWWKFKVRNMECTPVAWHSYRL